MHHQQGRKNGKKHSPTPGRSKHKSPQFYSFSFSNNLKLPGHWYHLPLVLFLVMGLSSCGSSSPPRPNPSDSPNQSVDSKLTFFNVTLEQFDEVGRPIWKVKAKEAKYTKEKQIGQVASPDGELYQDGQVVYKVQAEQADIQQDGKQLFLKGKILATDPRNGIVLQGNELEWRPKEDLLIVRNQLNGTHKQLKARATEAKVKTRDQRMEFSGQVVANSSDPQLQMRTEHLTWEIKTGKLISDRPVLMERYKNNQITDRGRGNSAQVDLKTKIATLQQKAQIELLDPPVQIASDAMTWNMNTEVVSTSTPIRAFHRAEKMTVTANQGEMKIPQKTVYLTGNVKAVGQRNQSLTSNVITWLLEKKLLLAQGNVIYRQANPQLTFTGDTAIGNLETENITVKGGNSGGKVVTEIIPQENQ
ncbi:MAG TPA: LPS export ABC transporter periplasmic protein LptC [Nostocaceae cyanobacterium]|nr:LPS export ABC transporter periplasmic protein LptC [Nostocaceae cyanobacterium]